MKFSLAPMLKVTTPQFRKLIRIISPDVILFTEMIPPGFILGRNEYMNRIGDFDENTVIQLGGNDPKTICDAIKRIIQDSPFRQFNLNVGCPSPKVTKGSFAASLMLRPEIVINIINRVFEETGIILSVKCRIGVDENDSYEFFCNFIEEISKNTKCDVFYVHARKCWLDGLSPKDNRNIPELKYDYVRRVKMKFPELKIHLNGGVKNIKDAEGLDGIMIGREAIQNIFVFENLKTHGTVSDCVSENDQSNFIFKILESYFSTFDQNKPISHIDVIPLMNLFRGRKGCKIFKKYLNVLACEKSIVKEIFSNKLSEMMSNLSLMDN